jgi:hypothetical protein
VASGKKEWQNMKESILAYIVIVCASGLPGLLIGMLLLVFPPTRPYYAWAGSIVWLALFAIFFSSLTRSDKVIE